MYKEDLALNNTQVLIYHKTKPNQTKIIYFSFIWFMLDYLVPLSQDKINREKFVVFWCIRNTFILKFCFDTISDFNAFILFLQNGPRDRE